MKKTMKPFTLLCLTGGLVLTQITGCSTSSKTETSAAAQQTKNETNTEAGQEITDISVTAELGEGGKKTITCLAEDLNSAWEEADSVQLTLSDQEITKNTNADDSSVLIEEHTIRITRGGTYVVNGSLSDGQIRIEAAKGELVHLILNGISLSSSTTSPIYAAEEAKVVLTLAKGTENHISDAEAYQFADEEEDEPNAAIFTTGDLTINGEGMLTVEGNYECGIRSKKNLLGISGTLSVTAKKDGLKGRDSIVIRDGSYQITAGKDGLKSNNDEDEDKGFIWIDNGSLQIAAEDDGIQAEHALIVYGGSIDITTCEEGLEGKTIDILDGSIQITASDDAINSAGLAETEWEKMQDQEGVYTRIAGGTLYLNAEADGIDSNGDLYIEGGTVYLSGPSKGGNGILDYNGSSSISGGTIIAAGSYSMMQYFSEESPQNFIVIHYPELQPADTLIKLINADGETLTEYAPEKEFEAAIISDPALTTGSICQVITGENTLDFTLTQGLNTYGEVSAENGFSPAFHGGHRSSDQNAPEGFTPPEGMTPPDGTNPPEKMTHPDGTERPEKMTPPDGTNPPEKMTHPNGTERPEKMTPPDGADRPEKTSPQAEENSAKQ